MANKRVKIAPFSRWDRPTASRFWAAIYPRQRTVELFQVLNDKFGTNFCINDRLGHNFAKEILELLEWKSYEKYQQDMQLLLQPIGSDSIEKITESESNIF